MPRRRSSQTIERDQRAYDLFRRGLSYRQICAEIGYSSSNAAFEAVRRAARENAVDPIEADAARQVFYDRFQDYRRAAQRVLSTRHYVTSQAGNLIDGPDGGFLLDESPILQAIDRLVKIDDVELKLRGLYPPARQRVEIVDDEVARALVDQMEAEIAALTADPGRDLA